MAGPVAVEGLDKLLQAFKDKDAKVQEAAMKGLQEGALNIIADAQVNLRDNSSVVTGLLRQSGKVEKVGKTDLDVGFFDRQNRQSGYAYFVEYGRRAGKMPPPDEMAAYVYKKFHLKDWKLARSIGWALAVRIAKSGTRPHAFFKPAIDKNKSRILEALKRAINKAT